MISFLKRFFEKVLAIQKLIIPLRCVRYVQHLNTESQVNIK